MSACGVCGVCNTKKVYKQHPNTATSPEVISPRSVSKRQVPNPSQSDEHVYYSQYTEQIFSLSLDDVIATGWCSASFKSVCVKWCDSFFLCEEARELMKIITKLKTLKGWCLGNRSNLQHPKGKTLLNGFITYCHLSCWRRNNEWGKWELPYQHLNRNEDCILTEIFNYSLAQQNLSDWL